MNLNKYRVLCEQIVQEYQVSLCLFNVYVVYDAPCHPWPENQSRQTIHWESTTVLAWWYLYIGLEKVRGITV